MCSLVGLSAPGSVLVPLSTGAGVEPDPPVHKRPVCTASARPEGDHRNRPPNMTKPW